MNFLKSKSTIIVLIILNLILIYSCSLDKGRGTFWAIPIDFVINLSFVIYAIVKKKDKLIVTSLILMFAAPMVGFIVFAMNFAFLTR